jgi:hypothetical protein
MNTYPVIVTGSLDEPLGRWRWLVKWLLALPHIICLAVLWVVAAVLTFCAFWVILFTGRYPRGIFDFNVGVMRWSWRVSYYALGVLGTDRYPPFTLAEVPDYPAHFDVEYPEQLRRGLPLIGWWLAGIPQYCIAGLLGGGLAVSHWHSAGVVSILMLVVGVMLLFKNEYPRGLYDLVMGLNRWTMRVTAYGMLMVREYPPFRLDQGGDEPAPTAPAAGAPLSA